MTPAQRAIHYCLSLPSFRTSDVAAISGEATSGSASYLRQLAKVGVVLETDQAGVWMPGQRDDVAAWRSRVARTKTKEGGNGAAYQRAKRAREEAERGARERAVLTSQPSTAMNNCAQPLHEEENGCAMRELTPLSEVAEALDVHPVTLLRWEKAGKIKVVTLPNGYKRVPVDEVRRLVTGRTNG